MKIRKNLLLLVAFVVSILFVPSVFAAECNSGSSNGTYKITAEDGEKYCTSISDAFANVKDNGTITLLKEDNISARVDITSEKNVTLDLDNYEIKGNVSGNVAIAFKKANVTIKASNANGKITNIGGGIMVAEGGSLTIESGLIEVSGTVAAVQIGNSSTSASIVVNGGTIKSTNATSGYALSVRYGDAQINNGLITASTPNTVVVGDEELVGSLVMTNGKIENTCSTSAMALMAQNGKTTIKGGTITSSAEGKTVQVGSPSGPNNVEFIFENGKIENTNSTKGLAILAAKGTTTISGGEVVNNNKSTTVQVGDKKDITAKLNVTGGTIENKDAESSVALIIPYGGSEATISGGNIKVNEDAEYNLAVILGANDDSVINTPAGEKAKLTITDGNITGGIALFGDKPELNVKGGNITSRSFAISGNGSPKGNINATVDSTINITGGTITSTSTAAIYHPQAGKLNITGGDITGHLGVVARAGEVNIGENAKITANGDPTKTYQVGDAMENGERVKLPGGAGVIVDNSETGYPNAAKVKITNGTFNTTGPSVVTYNDDENTSDDVVVSGGNFNQTIATQYLTEDVEQSESGVVGTVYDITVEDNANGKITVNKNAAVGETVKVSAIANEGYKLEKIIVTYEKNGKETGVEVTEDGTFVMPEGNVTVKATFTKLLTDVQPSEAPATYDNVFGYVILTLVTFGMAIIVSKKAFNR